MSREKAEAVESACAARELTKERSFSRVEELTSPDPEARLIGAEAHRANNAWAEGA